MDRIIWNLGVVAALSLSLVPTANAASYTAKGTSVLVRDVAIDATGCISRTTYLHGAEIVAHETGAPVESTTLYLALYSYDSCTGRYLGIESASVEGVAITSTPTGDVVQIVGDVSVRNSFTGAVRDVAVDLTFTEIETTYHGVSMGHYDQVDGTTFGYRFIGSSSSTDVAGTVDGVDMSAPEHAYINENISGSITVP